MLFRILPFIKIHFSPFKWIKWKKIKLMQNQNSPRQSNCSVKSRKYFWHKEWLLIAEVFLMTECGHHVSGRTGSCFCIHDLMHLLASTSREEDGGEQEHTVFSFWGKFKLLNTSVFNKWVPMCMQVIYKDLLEHLGLYLSFFLLTENNWTEVGGESLLRFWFLFFFKFSFSSSHRFCGTQDVPLQKAKVLFSRNVPA